MLLGWKLHLYGYKKKKEMDVECSSCRCTMLKGTGVSFILLCLMAEVSLSAQQVLRIETLGVGRDSRISRKTVPKHCENDLKLSSKYV
ncbi:hypothetical protein DPX16_13500 [Anabarilius grahami]|uniref:Uncharacterized protein n=1 Tax=Anabarilius grahami TaxID=495550 RepID=A0A3N0YBF1_ANAGA|nr:hypothetical protein DPX16_13500 [Anabarilius grahami]